MENSKKDITIGTFGGKIILGKRQKNDLERNNATIITQKRFTIINTVKKHRSAIGIITYLDKEIT